MQDLGKPLDLAYSDKLLTFEFSALDFTSPGTVRACARFDAAGFLSIPQVKGLVVSAGLTEIRPYRHADGGRILSAGGIYYTRVGIFSGNVNFNESLPSGLRSTSYPPHR